MVYVNPTSAAHTVFVCSFRCAVDLWQVSDVILGLKAAHGVLSHVYNAAWGMVSLHAPSEYSSHLRSAINSLF